MLALLETFDELYLQNHPIYLVRKYGDYDGAWLFMGSYEECLNYLNTTKEEYEKFIKWKDETDSPYSAPYRRIVPFTIENFKKELEWNNYNIIRNGAQEIRKKGNESIFRDGYTKAYKDYQKETEEPIEQIKKAIKALECI